MAHTLLLADDSVTIQRVIELTFADEDVQVVAVSDGDQAIARLDSAPPDIVLADIGMPGKNGYEVARYVKQSPKLSHIPVVLLTGAFEPVDHARAAEVKCDGVLAKPFEPQLVIGRVKELLSPAASPAAGVAPQPAEPAATGAESAAPNHAELDEYFDRLDIAFAKLSGKTAPNAAPAPPEIETTPTVDTAPVDFEWDEESEALAAAHAPMAEYATVADEIDRYAASHTPEPPADLPLSQVSLPPVFTAPPVTAPPITAPPVTAPQPGTPSLASAGPPAGDAATNPAPLSPPPATSTAVQTQFVTPHAQTWPTIAEAFAAILAAEHTESTPGVRPAWPTFPTPSPATATSMPAPAAAPAPSPVDVTDDLVELVTDRVLQQMSDSVVRETVSRIVSDVAERLIREEIERIKASLR